MLYVYTENRISKILTQIAQMTCLLINQFVSRIYEPRKSDCLIKGDET